MDEVSIEHVKERRCPVCNSLDLTQVSTQFIQCNSCKLLIDFNNDKLHVTECPLCSSKELTPLPSGNIKCEGCKNSFVAGKV
jgi:ribosomal protein L37AE/L43A